MFQHLVLIVSFASLFGCASGNCRSQAQAQVKATSAEGLKMPATTQDKARVYKYDGSLQCGMGKAVSPEDMKKELQGITVFSAVSKPDNLMRTQVCGSPTGKANVFEIDKVQLPEAKKRGFKEWTFD